MSQRRLFYIPNDDRRAILVDCYKGAYGQTLRIDVQSRESFDAFAGLLKRLAQNEEQETFLSSLGRTVFVAPLVDVRLLVSNIQDVAAEKLQDGVRITWDNPPDAWAEVFELLMGLTQSVQQGRGGHQYLTPPQAAVLVEFAFRE